MNKSGKWILFDSDGVLAKWYAQATKEEIYSPTSRYYLYREVQKNVRDTILLLCGAGMHVGILTAYPTEQAKMDKLFWMYAPETGAYTKDSLFVRGAGLPKVVPIIEVPYGTDKSEAIKKIADNPEDVILVDDYGNNLRKWRGVPVKFYNAVNGHGGTRYRYSVTDSMNPLMMMAYLSGIAMTA